jgi:hypothetical protein
MESPNAINKHKQGVEKHKGEHIIPAERWTSQNGFKEAPNKFARGLRWAPGKSGIMSIKAKFAARSPTFEAVNF